MSDIDDNNNHSSFLQNQSYIDSIIEGLQCVCRYCGLFDLKKKSQIFVIDDCLIHNFVISGLLVISNIHSCGISNDSICLCLICRKLLSLGNRPKFGILNGLPCTDCQSYLPALVDLSMAEKAAIACAHLFVSILKLCSSEIFNLAAYSGIKGHAVLFPQNLAPLLTLLHSLTLALHNILYNLWAG